MIGAIVGDLVGSQFEFWNPCIKDFELFTKDCWFTDDSVMTLAIAEAVVNWRTEGGELSRHAIEQMKLFGLKYPDAGYGLKFMDWIPQPEPKPYNSWGNGSAMRVSACGWAGRTLDEVKSMSHDVTAVTHNHPEGLKGAEAVAIAVYLARTGKSKGEICEVINSDYYRMNFKLDDIRDGFDFDVSCKGTVPPALEAFFESTSFEDAVRNAVSLGGDADTLGAISGSVAEAYYGVPDKIRSKAMSFLPQYLLDVLNRAEVMFDGGRK